MSVAVQYKYLGEGEVPVDDAPRPLTEEQIEYIIRTSLNYLYDAGVQDPVVRTQVQEFAFTLRRDLRRQRVCPSVSLSEYVRFIRVALLDAAILIQERVGTVAASATVADLQQMVISEKRGGSGKNSGLAIVSRFEEVITATENRKERYAWVYPASSNISESELILLKRDLVGVRLSEVILNTRTARYTELPEWYELLDEVPPQGYHFEIDLNLVRMANRGVLVSQVVDAIRDAMDAKIIPQVRFFSAPYHIGRIDIFFLSALSTLKATSNMGAQHVYAIKEGTYVKGTPGVEWVTERRVSLKSCIQESQQLNNSRWVTYFSLAPALRFCLGISHLRIWLDRSGLQYEMDEIGEHAFYTPTDPRPLLKKWMENPDSEELQLEIEYRGNRIVDFFHDRRFDVSRVVTNDPRANQEALGVDGARSYTGMELLDLVREIVAHYDSRHSETIADVMYATGSVTGISIKGLEQRGADAIQRLTFRQPEKVVRREAAFGLSTANATVGSSHFIGTQGILTGSNLWRTTPNPLAGVIGQQADPEYIATLRGIRIPRPTTSSEQILTEAREKKREEEVPLGRPARPTVKPGLISGRRVPRIVRTIEQ